METLKDIFQSVYDNYRDRVKNPLIGSFIITYLIFNWRSLAILFYSDWPIHCRIEWIDGKYFTWENFLLPLSISLFYVLILPYINIAFEILLKKHEDHRDEKSKKNRISNLEQRKYEAHLLRDIADAKAGTSAISNLNDRNDALKLELENLQKQNQDDLNRHRTSIETLKNNEADLLRKIENLEFKNSIDWVKLLNPEIEGPMGLTKTSIIEYAKSFTFEEKERFIKFVEKFRLGEVTIEINDVDLFSTSHLIDFKSDMSKRTPYVTDMGNLFYNFLKLGYDLF